MQCNKETQKEVNNDSGIVDLTQSTIMEKHEIKPSENVESSGNSSTIVESEITNIPKSATKYKKRQSNSSDADELSIAFCDLKRRKIKAAGAPKMPLNGYVRYMNERREKLRKEHPDKTALEHTRMIGEEWHQLPVDRKAPYIKSAEIDKQKYNTELAEFLKLHPEVVASELAKGKNAKNATDNSNSTNVHKEKSTISGKQKPTTSTATVAINNSNSNTNSTHKTEDNITNTLPPTSLPVAVQVTTIPAPVVTVAPSALPTETGTSVNEQINNIDFSKPTSPINTFSMPNHTNDNNFMNNSNNNSMHNANNITFIQGEIPIFTNEFLEHNKAFDMELRTLRKTKTDLEQQNAVLEKHVDNMKCGVKKLTDENTEIQEKNRLLQLYLDKTRQKLCKALAGLSIQNHGSGANLENIDKYMCDLAAMTTSNTHGPASLNKARDLLRKLDLHFQL